MKRLVQERWEEHVVDGLTSALLAMKVARDQEENGGLTDGNDGEDEEETTEDQIRYAYPPRSGL
jgi:hypothetical protein